MKKDQRKIDIIRNSGGMADIGTKEDGAIVEMVNLNGKLIVLKEKAIYEFKMADNVDPERENPNLPTNIQQKLVNQGSESELVSKLLIGPKMLLRSEFFEDSLDVNRATELSLELLQETIMLEKEINEYLEIEKKESEEYNKRKGEKVSYAIPSIGDVETRCKTIFQKADHIEQILMEIITIFYQNDKLTKQSHFPKFYEILKTKYGEEDLFTKYIESTLSFMVIIRGLRNGLDHRLPTTKVTDFELLKNSDVLSPTIEFKQKKDKLNRISLSEFLPIVLKNMIGIVELTITYLSGKNLKQNPFGYQIREIPEEKRKFPKVRYCFWSPMGTGGFYNQQLK